MNLQNKFSIIALSILAVTAIIGGIGYVYDKNQQAQLQANGKCKTNSSKNKNARCTYMEDGRERCWLTHVPASIETSELEEVPLVVFMHGYTGCAEQNEYYTGWKRAADINGFILVDAQSTENIDGAIDKQPSWNAGKCCGGSVEKQVDDVSFIRKLVELEMDTKRSKPIDASRVYMAGHSNGCAMAQRMGAEASDLVAAVGCHSFYLLVDAPDTFMPTPVIEVHGISDPTVPYVNPHQNWTTGAEDNFNLWKTLNKCEDGSLVRDDESFDQLFTMKFSNCADNTEVELVSVPIAGHFPFKGAHQPDMLNLFEPSLKADTTGMIYDFMKRFSRGDNGVIHKSTNPEIIAPSLLPDNKGGELAVDIEVTFFAVIGIVGAGVLVGTLLIRNILRNSKKQKQEDRLLPSSSTTDVPLLS